MGQGGKSENEKLITVARDMIVGCCLVACIMHDLYSALEGSVRNYFKAEKIIGICWLIKGN